MDQNPPQEVEMTTMPLSEDVSSDKFLRHAGGNADKDTPESEQEAEEVEGEGIVWTEALGASEEVPVEEYISQVHDGEGIDVKDVALEESTDSTDINCIEVETTTGKRADDAIATTEEKTLEKTLPEDACTVSAVSESEPKTTVEEEAVLVEGELTTKETEEANAGADRVVKQLHDPLMIEQQDAGIAADRHTEANAVAVVANEALTSFQNPLQISPTMKSASPVAIPDLLIASEDGSIGDSNDAAAVENHDSDDMLENGEKCEEGEHAIITAVAESADKAAHVDANMEVVLKKIRTKIKCESAEVLESGEVLVLPVGWSTRQSKSNDGKTYYVSPHGHTQWLRPPVKTGVIYNWVHEIEVTFGPGRLGLNLKQIAGIPGTEFTDLQVHIAEIYKLPNGMASPAEIYNWSVKPEKRLAVNMRVTMMNSIPLTGFTYSEVLELLARMARPVRIKFADISKGIVGRVDQEGPKEETEEIKEVRAARVMQNSLRMEYFRILVSSELHKQVWTVTKLRINHKRLEMEKKCDILETQVEQEQLRRKLLETEREKLIQEEASLKELIAKLNKQLVGEIESPEVLRAAQLVQRTAELEKEVTEIIAENEELQAIRVDTEGTLDTVQKELDEYRDLEADLNNLQDIKFFSPAFLGSIVERGSIDIRAADARERLLAKIKTQRDHLEEEVKLEEERTKFVESEINRFHNQMDVAAAAVKREDAFISGERPPQLIFLENKIALLQKNLKETVSGLSAATTSGDELQAANLSLRRATIKDDLAAALEEMRRMEHELQGFFDADEGKTVGLPTTDESIDIIDIDAAPYDRESESLRLQKKLTKLQTQLHETVVELAKAAGENDEARKSDLGTRRLQLKDEMKVVQDQVEVITNGSLHEATKNTNELPLRSSLVSLPQQQTPRKSSRASLGDAIRNSIGGRASLVGVRAFQSSHRPSTSVQRELERLDSSGSHRSNESASMGPLHDSNPNQLPRDGSLPRMCGILRKHPTHSNEKGTFGNMSLRGVRERWCSIEPDGYFRYYKREGDRAPRGAILLRHKSLEILHGKGVSKPNEFVICSPTHQTRLIAKSHDEMLKWVKVLQLAHAYFMEHATESSQAPDTSAYSHEKSVTSPDAELAYRDKRATLGF
ncbi:hypothetical protein PsorP6_009295 [Peronosclerospora sorghi]|uniref:Uncharacterized protein n=1 Tax=Peronosclerospora sorghi TaxID=230839 RepID=A0ACC0W0P1_9STRA|nr:hypothetical protein PsorP6_009295 [Peronosclerospora sorghi]